MSNSKTPIFADGMRVKRPGPAAPAIAIANVSFNKEQFIKFLEAQEGDVVYVNILASKSKDSWYAALSDWKPSDRQDRSSPQAKPAGHRKTPAVAAPGLDDFDDIPF